MSRSAGSGCWRLPKTPPDIIKQINEAVVAIMQSKEFRDHLAVRSAPNRSHRRRKSSAATSMPMLRNGASS